MDRGHGRGTHQTLSLSLSSSILSRSLFPAPRKMISLSKSMMNDRVSRTAQEQMHRLTSVNQSLIPKSEAAAHRWDPQGDRVVLGTPWACLP